LHLRSRREAGWRGIGRSSAKEEEHREEEEEEEGAEEEGRMLDGSLAFLDSMATLSSRYSHKSV
jgi:hypothetical protein